MTRPRPTKGLSQGQVEHLLTLAHVVVTWTGQDTIKPEAAATPHLREARHKYLKARIDAYAAVRPLTVADIGGCTCGFCERGADPDYENCLYHYAAQLQPDNHRIPWNCPTYYDGCNCEEKP